MIDFIIEGANLLDLLYGKKAQELVYPLFEQIIENIWSDWSYEVHAVKHPNTAECISTF